MNKIRVYYQSKKDWQGYGVNFYPYIFAVEIHHNGKTYKTHFAGCKIEGEGLGLDLLNDKGESRGSYCSGDDYITVPYQADGGQYYAKITITPEVEMALNVWRQDPENIKNGGLMPELKNGEEPEWSI